MTKYLIIFLLLISLLLLIIAFSPLLTNLGKSKIVPTPLPIISISPIPSTSQGIAPIQNHQAQADRNFAAKSKEIQDLYPWLDKLPIQTQNYFVYFDVNEKQFIAKLYPSSSSNLTVEQQVEGFKNEVKTKLQSNIPDYSKYNIRWDIKTK